MRDRSCCFCISKWDLHKAAWRRGRNSFSQCSREKMRRGGGGRRKQKIFIKAQIHLIGIFITRTLHHLIVHPRVVVVLPSDPPGSDPLFFFRKSYISDWSERLPKSPSFPWLTPLSPTTIQGFESWALLVYEEYFSRQ